MFTDRCTIHCMSSSNGDVHCGNCHDRSDDADICGLGPDIRIQADGDDSWRWVDNR